jgi:hypothetical protein
MHQRHGAKDYHFSQQGKSLLTLWCDPSVIQLRLRPPHNRTPWLYTTSPLRDFLRRTPNSGRSLCSVQASEPCLLRPPKLDGTSTPQISFATLIFSQLLSPPDA